MTPFSIITGPVVRQLLQAQPRRCIERVAEAYRQHHAGRSANPDSYFLRFPDQPANRIIALPAALLGERAVSGIKWIASYPANAQANLPRASAVLILNDPDTGYPIACLEAAQISAVRTAASAVLGAYWLNGHWRRTGSIGIVGGGVIARNILEMFVADEWRFNEVLVHDLDGASARALAQHAQGLGLAASVAPDLTAVLACDVVVFATTAATPYVPAERPFEPHQIVLNISLRDLAPEHILAADNYVDDVDHCLKAGTSPHLAEQQVGHRHFITGTLAQLMLGEVRLDLGRPRIFSPFGMGILDLALGLDLLEQASLQGLAQAVPDFFAETARWQAA